MQIKEKTDLSLRNWEPVGEPVEWELTPAGGAKFWVIESGE
ncbi:MAG: hypothetical protein ACSHYA_16650 [Opitutaceae bacterium]